MRWLGLLVLVACAAKPISPASYERLSSSVAERNEQRYQAAWAELGRQGYVTASDQVQHARALEATLQTCRDPKRSEGDVSFAVGEVTVTARTGEACAFLRDQRPAIDVTRADGTSARLRRIADNQAVMRDAKGGLVLVAITKQVSTRKVLVASPCDRMPRLRPDPIEFETTVIWAPPDPLRETTIRVELEELDVECTDPTS